MPVYLYKCQSCSAEFERFQMFSERPLTLCPVCHLIAVHRIPQLPSVIFRGHGWYSIDHRAPSGQKSDAPVEKSGRAGSTNGKKRDS